MEIHSILTEKLAKPDKTIEEHTKEVIIKLDMLNQLGYIPTNKIYELTKKACEFHDLGKVNQEFQKRVQAKNEKIEFNIQKEVPHNVLSGYFIDPKEFENKEEYYKVLFSVLYHHHYGDAIKVIESKKDLIKSLLAEFPHNKIKVSTIHAINQLLEREDTETLWIKGLLHKCDYSASAGYSIEYPNHFLESSLEKLLGKWKEKNPDAKWRELQQFCIQNRNHNIIGIAQTGMGKTEGGMLWIGDNKGFFILPIRTAINAIYERITNDLLDKKEVSEKVGILYSNSLEYYMKNVEEEKDKLVEYEQRGKALSLPLSISTLDQLFDFVFKYPAYELKLATLSYSKVVIDEIQMYEPNLLAYLIYGLKMIHHMGGKIAILTATFSPFLRKLLSPIEFVEEKFIDDTKRHNVKVLDAQLNAEDIYCYYKESKVSANSGKVLVICNTIKKAQQIYEELIEIGGQKEELHILHSQYIKKERAEKEREILKFGQTFDENGQINCGFGIWISTSLVEASLDIDFDALFTELKDLSSLFQRFGRCNRKGAKSTEDVNCFVYTQIDINGTDSFIDKDIYELSINALDNLSGILLEERKIQLIEEYFTFENLKNSNYMREYTKVSNFLDSLELYKEVKEGINLREIQSEDIIPSNIYEKHIDEIRDMEKQLAKGDISKLERLEIIDKISQYTVSVPKYKVKKYEKNVENKLAVSYTGVTISSYRKIKIMECYYDEMGFREIDFNNYIRTANCL